MHKHKIVLRSRQEFFRACKDPNFCDKVNRGLIEYNPIDLLSEEKKKHLGKFWNLKKVQLSDWSNGLAIKGDRRHIILSVFNYKTEEIRVSLFGKTERTGWKTLLRTWDSCIEYKFYTGILDLSEYFQDPLNPTEDELTLLELDDPEIYKLIMENSIRG